MTDVFRLWFVVTYLVGFVFFLVLIFRFRTRRPAVEQRRGPLPPSAALISWLIPSIILLTGVGHIAAALAGSGVRRAELDPACAVVDDPGRVDEGGGRGGAVAVR